ncbi:sensor histidine kinase [uncultured Amnibacterium sp.]|uniref:sensor histidine kinase n=1 Tax=uncultured Amnibacterium sp. TaxID=1631851 RepID=UPI0035CC40F7
MSRRRAAALLAPAAVAVGAAGLLLVAAPMLTVTVSFTAVAAALVVAALAAVVAVLLLEAARRRASREQELEARLHRKAADSHRRFVARLDHELKNPLTALLSALAADDPTGSRRARAQADRIRRLLADLRRIADVEAAPLDRVTVLVEPLLRDAVELVLAETGAARQVRIDVPTAPWPPALEGDPDLLLIAVYNVVANAVKYTDPDDVIEVRAREARGATAMVAIEIADTGPGIGADDQGIVWEELERGHPPADVPGSGIGLALTRVIVDRHGGRCELTSRVGQGTSVVLEVPAARAAG